MDLLQEMRCKCCGKRLRKMMEKLHRCKCGDLYCHNHKLSHDCAHDYRAEHREKLEKFLEKVDVKKVETF